MGDQLQIKIESILGGHSPATHFASPDQFRASLGIDPGLPIIDTVSNSSSLTKLGIVSSGLLRPTPTQAVSGTLNSVPLWIKRMGKMTDNIIMLDFQGSAYTFNSSISTFTGMSDGGSLSNGQGNGLEYYDNFAYFAKNTTIARYGPLDFGLSGVPTTPFFDGNYWAGTLGMSALTNPYVPIDPSYTRNLLYLPNHCMKRHSDGKLYVLDVNSSNQAVVHRISTTKGANYEGETNAGSTYQVLTLGYGLKPLAIESYGSDLVIACVEWEQSSVVTSSRAKLAFWDTNSANFNKIIWVEYPDDYISAMKNVNGVLYVTSGNYAGIIGASGFRVTRFVGGYTFEEVHYAQTGIPPFPGAIDGSSNRLIFGSYTTVPELAGCVYSLGLENAKLSKGLFNIMRATGSVGTGGNSAISVFSVMLQRGYDSGFHFDTVMCGWANDTPEQGVDVSGYGSGYGNSTPIWWSQLYKIGQPFNIKRIRLPLVQPVSSSNHTLIAKIFFDSGGFSQELTYVTGSTFAGKNVVNLYTAGDGATIMRGENNFWLELRWLGTSLLTVDLPILIDLETVDD